MWLLIILYHSLSHISLARLGRMGRKFCYWHYLCHIYVVFSSFFQGLRDLFFEKYRSNDGYMISSRLLQDGLDGYMGILFFSVSFLVLFLYFGGNR